MEIQEIEVIIGKGGQVQIHVKGVNGFSCLDLTQALEAALGQVEAREMTPEAYQTTQEQNTNFER